MVLPTQIHGVFTGFILPVKKVRYSLLFLIRHIPLPMTKRPDIMTEYKCLMKFWPIWKWDIALKTWNISHYAYGIYWAHSVMFHNSGSQQAQTTGFSPKHHQLHEKNLHKQLTLEEIATYAKYSPTYLSNIFSQKSGMSIINYFNLLKIQKACSLLDFTDKKIKEIAYELAFNDPYYFSKVFTKHMHLSPREYREKKKG